MVVVGAGIYLGLAIFARGGIAAFFSQPALIALTVVFAVLCAVALFAGGNLSSGVREDRANRWVIGVFSVIGLLQAFLPAWTDRKGIWIIDGDAVRWLGCDSVCSRRRDCASGRSSCSAPDLAG